MIPYRRAVQRTLFARLVRVSVPPRAPIADHTPYERVALPIAAAAAREESSENSPHLKLSSFARERRVSDRERKRKTHTHTDPHHLIPSTKPPSTFSYGAPHGRLCFSKVRYAHTLSARLKRTAGAVTDENRAYTRWSFLRVLFEPPAAARLKPVRVPIVEGRE